MKNMTDDQMKQKLNDTLTADDLRIVKAFMDMPESRIEYGCGHAFFSIKTTKLCKMIGVKNHDISESFIRLRGCGMKWNNCSFGVISKAVMNEETEEIEVMFPIEFIKAYKQGVFDLDSTIADKEEQEDEIFWTKFCAGQGRVQVIQKKDYKKYGLDE